MKAALSLSLIAAALSVSACAPRYGHNDKDPALLPVEGYSFYDSRYTSPAETVVPDTLPAGVFKSSQQR